MNGLEIEEIRNKHTKEIENCLMPELEEKSVYEEWMEQNIPFLKQ